jgi:hypothetical protein
MSIAPAQILTSIQRPEDAVNAALVKIGYPIRLDQMMEGSAASIAAVRVYGQTRDDLMIRLEPKFARRDAALQLLKAAPVPGYNPMQMFDPAAHPPLPWRYAYAYPVDALQILSLQPQPFLLTGMSPRAVPWQLAEDYTVSPVRKLVLTDLPMGVVATYTGRETNPRVWDAVFCRALIDELADALRPVLMPKVPDAGAAAVAVRDAAGARHERG